MRVRSVVHRPTTRQSRFAPRSSSGALVYDTAQRLDQEHHVITQPIGDRRELNAASSTLLSYRTAVGVEQTLQNSEAHIGRIEEIVRRG